MGQIHKALFFKVFIINCQQQQSRTNLYLPLRRLGTLEMIQPRDPMSYFCLSIFLVKNAVNLPNRRAQLILHLQQNLHCVQTVHYQVISNASRLSGLDISCSNTSLWIPITYCHHAILRNLPMQLPTFSIYLELTLSSVDRPLRLTNRSRNNDRLSAIDPCFGASISIDIAILELKFLIVLFTLLLLAIMVFKHRRNDGKRFTASRDTDSNNKVSVFTQLNDLERSKQATKIESTKSSDTEFAHIMHSLKMGQEVGGNMQQGQYGTNDMSPNAEAGWTIIRSKKSGKNKEPVAATRVLPDIHFPATNTIPVLDIHTAHHWPIDIRIDTEDNEAVNIKSLLSNTLNSFQDNDANTMIAPINYEEDPDPNKYILKGNDIPADELLLRNYILRIKTQPESILVSAIFVTNSYLYQLIEGQTQYYEEANISLRLNLLQADKTVIAGFFIELLAKTEFLYDYQCRIQELLGTTAPSFQVILFDLNFRQKGQRFPTVRSKVFAIQVEENDLQEMVFVLTTACKFSNQYHFIAWDAYAGLQDEQKIKLIDVQNTYCKNHVSFRIDGFNHEPVGLTMHMLPTPVETLHPDESPPRSPAANLPAAQMASTPKQRNSQTKTASTGSGPKIQVQTVKDNWDDDDEELEVVEPTTVTPEQIDGVKAVVQADLQADIESDHIMREPSSVQHTPPVIQRSDKPDKRLCMTNETDQSQALLGQSYRTVSHMTITDFLRSIKSGDGEPLFCTVNDRVNGARELIGLTRKQREIRSFLAVVHLEIARQMNMTARMMMYPDQTIDNPKSFYNQPQWRPIDLSGIIHLQAQYSGTGSTVSSSSINYEYRTDGKRYYNNSKDSNQAMVVTYGTKKQTISSDIVTLYPQGNQAMMIRPTPLQRPHSTVSVQSSSSFDTYGNSTITSGTDDDINGLRAELTAMRFQQSRLNREVTTLTQQADQSPTFYQSALERFENQIMDKTLQVIQTATANLQNEVDQKISHKEQLINNQLTVMQQELEASRNTGNATLAAIQEFMRSQQQQMQVQNQQLVAQQQQMQAQQQQMQTQQQLNQDLQTQLLDFQRQSSTLHQTLVDRLTATDQSLSLFQQSASIQEAQLNLLASTKNVPVVSTSATSIPSGNASASPSNPTTSPTIQAATSSTTVPNTQSSKSVAVTPTTSTLKSTQTTITSKPDGTMQLSSSVALKHGGLSSRSIGKGSTKEL